MQLMEREAGQFLLGFRRSGFVVKTMDGHRRIGGTPALDVGGVPVIQEIDQQIIASASRPLQFKKELAAQNRRANVQFFAGQIISAIK